MKSSSATKSGSASATHRTAHLVKSNTRSNGHTSGKRAPEHVKGKSAQTGVAATPVGESDKAKYTVIITNVENDFGKLHKACLPHYCGLRSDYEEMLDAERLTNDGGPQARRLTAAVRGCSYAVRCRTETRSAEISLYGPANADFAPMQLNKTPRRLPTLATSSAKATQKDASTPVENVSEVTTTASIGAVEQLALRLRRQHYFEEKLPVSVHLPGRTAGEVLLRIDEDGAPTGALNSGEDREAHEDDHADLQEDSDSTPVAVSAAGEKRPHSVRGDSNEGDTPSPQRVKTEAPEDNAKTPRHDKTTKREGDPNVSNSDKQSKRMKSKSPRIITQFPRRQKDFVTAVAALSSRVPLQRVRNRLRDLPGYLSCWPLYDRHFRVVFRDAESLFKAKQLLDQFELDAGLRVSLLLSDALSRTNAEFVRAQEGEDANE
ncbi:hypothetical protein JKF63_06288 [Porcisia hertigi]|uniref:Uncharacterized protein n=1 Tax=Porcisia hertigi TaxID=2761500 RepID=A0A836IUA0_9TRYP|nr:hypothetical protein JKF63_06288 [Porcisia hertigi]